MIGCLNQAFCSVIVGDENSADSPHFMPLVETTAACGFKVETVVADKAYLSHANLELVDCRGATAYVPFKSNSQSGQPGSVWAKMYAHFTLKWDEFLKTYHARSNVESEFAAQKAKYRDGCMSKTDMAMKNEVLAKCLCA